jgi:hypothetical protein
LADVTEQEALVGHHQERPGRFGKVIGSKGKLDRVDRHVDTGEPGRC